MSMSSNLHFQWQVNQYYKIWGFYSACANSCITDSCKDLNTITCEVQEETEAKYTLQLWGVYKAVYTTPASPQYQVGGHCSVSNDW